MDEQPFARLDPRAADQRDMGGQIADGIGRRLFPAERRGLGTQDRGAHDAIFGHRAMVIAADHGIADAPARHAFAQRVDFARKFQAGDERQVGLQLISAARYQQVGKVHCRRAHAQAHFARSRYGHRHVGQPHAAMIGQQFAHLQGAHVKTLSYIYPIWFIIDLSRTKGANHVLIRSRRRRLDRSRHRP